MQRQHHKTTTFASRFSLLFSHVLLLPTTTTRLHHTTTDSRTHADHTEHLYHFSTTTGRDMLYDKGSLQKPENWLLQPHRQERLQADRVLLRWTHRAVHAATHKPAASIPSPSAALSASNGPQLPQPGNIPVTKPSKVQSPSVPRSCVSSDVVRLVLLCGRPVWIAGEARASVDAPLVVHRQGCRAQRLCCCRPLAPGSAAATAAAAAAAASRRGPAAAEAPPRGDWRAQVVCAPVACAARVAEDRLCWWATAPLW